MPTTTPQNPLPGDENYFKIWDLELKHSALRWTITTFFLGVSFALFGFSLQGKSTGVPLFISQAGAIAVYWFAYVVFRLFRQFGNHLRDTLIRMEVTGQTSLNLQGEALDYLDRRRRLTATNWLVVFGIFYTLTAIIISVFVQL